MLQAVGSVTTPSNAVCGRIIKLVTNFTLVGIPQIQHQGARWVPLPVIRSSSSSA
jgi:hypothetical protein